jgi:hypothetical protein
LIAPRFRHAYFIAGFRHFAAIRRRPIFAFAIAADYAAAAAC